MLNRRSVEFDTMIYPQAGLPESARAVEPLTGDDWVHPSQVVSQYTYLRRAGAGGTYAPPEAQNLFFIPYFQFLSGDAGPLSRQTAAFEAGSDTVTPFDGGGRVDHRNLTARHFEWVDKQIGAIEHHVAGEVRPEVRNYLDAIRPYAQPGGKKTPAAND